jgi:hypothetical protein
MSTFERVTAALIDEGRFLSDLDADLTKAVRALMSHVREHGVEATKGAKAEVKASIAIRFDGMDESDYSLKTSLKVSVPGRPPHATKAVAEYQKGEEGLFVRASGSTEGEDARQLRLATKDGRGIDPTTGEILEPAKKEMGR